MDLFWKDITTRPKNGRVFLAKGKDHKEFFCQYTSVPDGLGYYGYLKLIDYDPKTDYFTDRVEVFPTHWREKN